MSEKLREKLITHESENEDDICPRCRGKSTSPVFPFGEDSFYCENDNCEVTRFDFSGYYVETKEPLGTPNVQNIPEDMKKKHK